MNHLSLADWRHLNFDLLRCYRRQLYPQHRRVALTRPADWSLWIVESGWAQVHLEDGQYAHAGAGEILQPPPLISRVQTFSDDAHIISIGWHAHWEDGFPLFHQPEPLIWQTENCPDLLAASASLCTCYHDQMTHAATCESLLFWADGERIFHTWIRTWLAQMQQTLGAITRPEAYDPRLKLALRLLRSQGSGGPVPYALMQKELQLSRVHIDRLFRRHLGMTPKACLNQLLLQRVTRDILSLSCSFKEIAYRHGFPNPAHFSTWFQRQTGYSPQSWRDLHTH